MERKNWYFVHWFGTAQHGYVRKKDCLPFLAHKNHFMNKPVKSSKWALALTEIMGKQADQDRKAGTYPNAPGYKQRRSCLACDPKTLCKNSSLVLFSVFLCHFSRV